MIASIDDAWNWYRAVHSLTRSMERLGQKYWTILPWEGPLGRDNRFRELEAHDVLKMSGAVLRDLDDLAVLLLFSVFEAIIRGRVLEEVAVELPEFRHPALLAAVRRLNEAIEKGSFSHVLEPYKGLDAGLAEEVKQVLQYRNWVAHGRRGDQPSAVDPQVAYDRLRRLLEILPVSPATGILDPE